MTCCATYAARGSDARFTESLETSMLGEGITRSQILELQVIFHSLTTALRLEYKDNVV